jgi:hypothetical protein
MDKKTTPPPGLRQVGFIAFKPDTRADIDESMRASGVGKVIKDTVAEINRRSKQVR